jgi:hypothetical protein
MTMQDFAGLAHTVVSAAPSGTSFTDYLIGWGTTALAAATFTAVAVSIRQESNRRNRETAERDRHWRAQARLVLTDMPGPMPTDPGGYQLVFRLQNYGNQPVLDAHAEAWAASAPLHQPPTWALQTRIVQPGPNEQWFLRTLGSSAPSLHAWRYLWTDAYGRKWCVDQPQQPEPLPFTGQQPRPY